jgi:hypothetical protein
MKKIIFLICLFLVVPVSAHATEYLVEWDVVGQVSAECPCNQPFEDEYGRVNNSFYTVVCFDVVQTHQARYFESWEDVEKFIATGENQPGLENFTLAIIGED